MDGRSELFVHPRQESRINIVKNSQFEITGSERETRKSLDVFVRLRFSKNKIYIVYK